MLNVLAGGINKAFIRPLEYSIKVMVMFLLQGALIYTRCLFRPTLNKHFANAVFLEV